MGDKSTEFYSADNPWKSLRAKFGENHLGSKKGRNGYGIAFTLQYPWKYDYILMPLFIIT